MNPNQPGRTLDKENNIAPEAASSQVSSFKQSSLLGSRTPRTPTGKQAPGLQVNPVKPSSLQGKSSTMSVSSPSAQSVLRTKTNLPQLPPAATGGGGENDPSDTVGKKTLSRTFSTLSESGTISSQEASAPASTNTENRRRSLTRRGSAKMRLVVHKDDPSPEAIEGESSNFHSSSSPVHKSTSKASGSSIRIDAPKNLETTTTQLSVERSLESEEKVIVGVAESQNKRRALMNDDERLEIEYCPPPVEEQPFDPGFHIDYSVFASQPPPLAYYIRSVKDFDIPDPVFEDAEILRPSVRAGVAATPTTRITKNGHFEVMWDGDEENQGSDGENDYHVHPKGIGRSLGIKDLHDDSKTRPPFDGFLFDLNTSDDSLSEDEDDILGGSNATIVDSQSVLKVASDFISEGPKADVNGGFKAPVVTVGSELARLESSLRGDDVGDHPTKDKVEQAPSPSREFNDDFGLTDLNDESKIKAPFSDFNFEL